MEESSIDKWSLSAWERHLGRPIDGEAVRRELAQGTIAAAASASARRFPDREAVRVGEFALTHAELDHLARKTASWLREREVGPGARVLLAGPTSLDFVTAYLGTLHAGASATFANPLLTAPELKRIVEDARPAVAFAGNSRFEQLEQLKGEQHDVLREVIEIAAAEPVLPDLLAGYPPAQFEGRSSDEAHLAFTSGTTGHPKATPLTHANLLASIRSLMLAWQWAPDDVLVHALPMTHGHGLSGLQAVLISGCRGVFLPSFDEDLLCREVRARRGTVLFAVPAIWERLLGWDGFRRADLSSLRIATSGSAPLNPDTSDAVAKILGHRPLERYGCTETGYTLSNPSEGPRRAGTVGIPLPGAEVRIVDSEGVPVPHGRAGEIVARGPQVFGGYVGYENADSFLVNGWFKTGDVGEVDRAGYVRITGRAKDLIISGGLNVYPREVEIALERQGGVAAAAVVGVPSKKWGEEVVAFVVAAEGVELTGGDVLGSLRDELASYKCPKRVFIVDELPRNHMGKILRTTLLRGVVRDPED